MKLDIIPAGITGKELFDFVVKNEALILHAKKSETKRADSVFFSSSAESTLKNIAGKSFAEGGVITDDTNRLKVELVINTTNYMDSHMDVHIPGLWNKSISDNKKAGFYLLERHQNDHRSVIGYGMKARTEIKSWGDLGYATSGNTEALIFSGEIEKGDNEFMFNQYARNKVKQHSVGMQYVKILTCIDDKDYPVQKENWDKYFPMVSNADEAKDAGIFWAVLEAKIKEGSAVLFGSNDRTPTYSTSTKNEPPVGTQEEPPIVKNDVFSWANKAFKN